MVSLALFGGYLTNIGQETDANGHLQLNILEPFVFAGLLFGAMLPYWYVNMTCV
jgi:Na+/H+-translocating membrane pyrophosphatase